MNFELLIGHRAPEARIAVRAGAPITAGHFVADAAALARQLPPAQYVLNGCRDRYWFAVGFGAALLAGRTLCRRARRKHWRMAMRYPDTLYLGDEAGHMPWNRGSTSHNRVANRDGLVGVAAAGNRREHVAAIARRAAPVSPRRSRTWCLVDGALEVALQLDEAPIDDVVLMDGLAAAYVRFRIDGATGVARPVAFCSGIRASMKSVPSCRRPLGGAC
jgi:hypothetical protein